MCIKERGREGVRERVREKGEKKEIKIKRVRRFVSLSVFDFLSLCFGLCVCVREG